MDSRLIRNAIMISLCMTVIILLAVIIGNWPDIKARYGISGSDNRLAAEEELTEGENPPAAASQVGSDLRGFMSDAAFFDKENLKESQISVTYGRTAALILSSAEKDLKVHIVDSLGKNIKGEEFAVTVEGVGDYKDSDQDGIIYVKPLRAGEYSVTLHPCEGFLTPEEPSVINVKQTIEYVALNAIDLIILTEDEIDTAKEDTANKTAEADRDATEQTEGTAPRAGAKRGIDVSKWNREIDWDKVKAAGVEFAIIRVGYRGYTSGSLIMDPYFEANIRGATNAGIPVGVYFFSQAVTPLEAVEEASMVIELCDNYYLNYPVFLDSESTGANGRADSLSAEKRTELSVAFLETIQNAGYEAGIYGARNWFGNNLQMDQLEDYIIWLAEYREVPIYQGYYHMWQYSSKGSIDGINGNVDLNISYLH